jgi:adenosylcobinamide kinase / adenosylcobinamide-phosphate guanylyltransferase
VREEVLMDNRMVLVIGGARSGKSSFAQSMAADSGRRVCFLATAEARDSEMSERIQRHRLNRPADWKTLELEEGIHLGRFPEDVDTVLFDCFTVYAANLMAANGLDWEAEDEDLLSEDDVMAFMDRTEAEALRTLDEVRKRVETLIVVSNEVGTGLVPPFRLGRIFRDLAGRLNQKMAQRADEVFLVSAGLPLRLKPGDTEVKRG